MPTALLDFQHELLADGSAGGLVFGRAGTTYVTLEPPQIVPGDGRYGDTDDDREDGTAFGEDYLSGKTVAFEIGVDTTDTANPHADNADALEDLEDAWYDPAMRSNGAIAVLRSRAVPGRTRRAYGRPRRFADTTSRLTHRGYSTVVADFQTRDGKWYDDEPQSITMTSGFLVQSVVIGGRVSTWPVMTFRGPLTNPLVRVGDYVMSIAADIPTGMTVVYDPRPWKRTVLRSDGANYAGKVTPGSPPMKSLRLRPGVARMGLLSAGGGSLDIEWRPAYSRW